MPPRTDTTPHPPCPRQALRPWQNWARTERCLPDTSFFPERLADLQEIVREAARQRRKVRVVGTGHSFSAVVPTDDYLVFISRLNRVAVDTSDPAQPRVVAEAGATNREINDVLERHGLALPTNVLLEEVRIGGLVATASHGSGWDCPTLSDLVHAIEIVDASGALRTFREGAVGADVMNAARASLGLFGITYRITLNVQRSYRVRVVDRWVPVAETLRDIRSIVLAHDSVDLFWWPFSDRLWLRTVDRTDAPRTARPRKSRLEAFASRLQMEGARLAAAAVVRRPSWTPRFCRAVFAVLRRITEGERVVDIIDAVHYRRAIGAMRVGCAEFAFKLDPGFASLHAAWQAVLDQTAAEARAGRYPFNLTLNARFIGSSAALLSPATGPGHTCYIEVLSHDKTPGWRAFTAAVCQEWMKLPGARPHWAKEFAHIPGIRSFVRAAYGENLERFVRIRDALGVDPERMFTNPLLESIFFPREAARPTPPPRDVEGPASTCRWYPDVRARGPSQRHALRRGPR